MSACLQIALYTFPLLWIALFIVSILKFDLSLVLTLFANMIAVLDFGIALYP